MTTSVKRNRPLSQKQHDFTINYFDTGHGTQSAINAGYSKRSAHSTSTYLLKNPKIQQELTRLRDLKQAQIIKESVAEQLEAAQTATEIMRARAGQFMDPETGEITSNPESFMTAGVSEVRVTRGVSKTGDPWEARTIKLRDPLAGADYLAKLYGWYHENPGAGPNITVNMDKVVIEAGTRLEQLLESQSKRLQLPEPSDDTSLDTPETPQNAREAYPQEQAD
jgi:phage terminase small subunit